jgi:hypothetical protein
MAALILHIHREMIHHGADIALLRYLYRARSGEARNRVILVSPGIVVR